MRETALKSPFQQFLFIAVLNADGRYHFIVLDELEFVLAMVVVVGVETFLAYELSYVSRFRQWNPDDIAKTFDFALYVCHDHQPIVYDITQFLLAQ